MNINSSYSNPQKLRELIMLETGLSQAQVLQVQEKVTQQHQNQQNYILGVGLSSGKLTPNKQISGGSSSQKRLSQLLGIKPKQPQFQSKSNNDKIKDFLSGSAQNSNYQQLTNYQQSEKLSTEPNTNKKQSFPSKIMNKSGLLQQKLGFDPKQPQVLQNNKNLVKTLFQNTPSPQEQEEIVEIQSIDETVNQQSIQVNQDNNTISEFNCENQENDASNNKMEIVMQEDITPANVQNDEKTITQIEDEHHIQLHDEDLDITLQEEKLEQKEEENIVNKSQDVVEIEQRIEIIQISLEDVQMIEEYSAVQQQFNETATQEVQESEQIIDSIEEKVDDKVQDLQIVIENLNESHLIIEEPILQVKVENQNISEHILEDQKEEQVNRNELQETQVVAQIVIVQNIKPKMVDACIQYESQEILDLPSQTIQDAETQEKSDIINEIQIPQIDKDIPTQNQELQQSTQTQQQQKKIEQTEQSVNQLQEQETYVLYQPDTQQKNKQVHRFLQMFELQESDSKIEQENLFEPNHKNKRDLKSLLKSQQKHEQQSKKHVKFNLDANLQEDENKISLVQKIKQQKKLFQNPNYQKEQEDIFWNNLDKISEQNHKEMQAKKDSEHVKVASIPQIISEKSAYQLYQEKKLIFQERDEGKITPQKKLVSQMKNNSSKRNYNTAFYQSQNIFGTSYLPIVRNQKSSDSDLSDEDQFHEDSHISE
eukprot:403340914